jgi:hypothetical protein
MLIMDIVLPEAMYAEVAPLPVPMAQHLYSSFIKSSPDPLNDSSYFWEELQEKRRSVYAYMDSFVRNRDGQLPHHLRYTTQWLRENLGHYTPGKQPIPPKTFNHWVKNGFIRNTRKGQPTPDSGAAVYIMRMMVKGTKLLYDSLPTDVAPWVCFAQDAPGSQPCCVPINEIEQLSHPAALLWTPWAGAAWDPHWMLLSNVLEGKYFGAIRFAHAEAMHGETFYMVSPEDIISWLPGYTNLFDAGPFTVDKLQRIARVALTDLAVGRVPSY